MSSEEFSPNASTSPVAQDRPVFVPQLPQSRLKNAPNNSLLPPVPASLQEAALNHFDKKYKIIEKMGNGVYGAVYKVVQKGTANSSGDATYFAAKKLFFKTEDHRQ